MALSSTDITIVVRVKGFAAADAPMAGIDKAGLSNVVKQWVRTNFPTRTPHPASVSNSENQYPNTNEVHGAVSASGTKAAQPAGDLTTAQAEPVTIVSITVA